MLQLYLLHKDIVISKKELVKKTINYGFIYISK
jgi:hypothetical protein